MGVNESLVGWHTGHLSSSSRLHREKVIRDVSRIFCIAIKDTEFESEAECIWIVKLVRNCHPFGVEVSAIRLGPSAIGLRWLVANKHCNSKTYASGYQNAQL